MVTHVLLTSALKLTVLLSGPDNAKYSLEGLSSLLGRQQQRLMICDIQLAGY
jgi:hypothetical protein